MPNTEQRETQPRHRRTVFLCQRAAIAQRIKRCHASWQRAAAALATLLLLIGVFTVAATPAEAAFHPAAPVLSGVEAFAAQAAEIPRAVLEALQSRLRNLVDAVAGFAETLTPATDRRLLEEAAQGTARPSSVAPSPAVSDELSDLREEIERLKQAGLSVETAATPRIVERIVPGITPQTLTASLNILENELRKEITQVADSGEAQRTIIYRNLAHTQKIDKLSNVTLSNVFGLTDADIPDGITASNYLPLSGGTVSGSLTLLGNSLFQAGGDSSTTYTPVIVGSVKLTTNIADPNPTEIFVSGRYAYIVNEFDDSLHIVDVSEPTSPSVVGNIKDATNLDCATDVHVSGNYAYVTSCGSDSLNVIDVSDPANPVIVGAVADATNLDIARSVFVSGRYAYVTAQNDDSLRIIDVSDPANPVIVGGVKDATNLDGARGLFISGRYAYVTARNDDSLRIIDISDPTNPTIVGGLKDSTNLDGPLGIHVSGRYAYVVNPDSDSLRVIDVSDPANPTIVGGVQDTSRLDFENIDFQVGRDMNGERGELQINRLGGIVGIGPLGSGSTHDFGLELVASTTSGYFGVSSGANQDGDLFTIDASGNVGIGTTSPGWMLQLYKADPGPVISLDGRGGTGGKEWIIQSSAASAGQGQGKLVFRQHTGGVDAMVIDSSGNVGLGTTSPWRTLSVDGKVSFANLSTGGADSDININGNNEIFKVTSSRRYKKDITDLEIDTDKLYDLRPASFTWKEGLDKGERDFGLIAEEVDEVLPELVSYNASGTAESVRYSLLSVLLLNQLQALAEKIADLADRVAGFAKRFVSDELVARNQLCVGEVCVTEAELAALLKDEPVDSASLSENTGEDEPNQEDTEPPVITTIGNNPAYVELGATYSDLGARVADNVNDNLGYQTYLDGVRVSEIRVDTSTTTEYKIAYVATDQAGNTATTTRKVIVYDPDAPTGEAVPPADTATSSEADSGEATVPDTDTESVTTAVATSSPAGGDIAATTTESISSESPQPPAN